MNIVLGITGSVATILVPKLVMSLEGAGHTIKVVATTPAMYFLPEHPGELDIYLDKDELEPGGYHKGDVVKHIDFRTWADILLIAPLTANTLAKIANGYADNFLSCLARAWTKDKPLILAPAMNTEMYIDPITNEHLHSIKKRFHNVVVINPQSKLLACGDIGEGAMADISEIVRVVSKIEI